MRVCKSVSIIKEIENGKNDYMDCLTGILFLMSRISTWKKKAAAAFLVVGQRATTKEERKWGYRNAFRAGESVDTN